MSRRQNQNIRQKKQISVNKVKMFALQRIPLRSEKELTDERNYLQTRCLTGNSGTINKAGPYFSMNMEFEEASPQRRQKR